MNDNMQPTNQKLSEDTRNLNFDLRRVLRMFYEEAKLCRNNDEREQLITRTMKKIQECKFCSFEAVQREVSRYHENEEVRSYGDK